FLFCCCVFVFFFFFFFFQAEDGIRDLIVTGVQTCALPISPLRRSGRDRGLTQDFHSDRALARDHVRIFVGVDKAEPECLCQALRSEERRVGKECRSRWGLNRLKKKERSSESHRRSEGNSSM